MKTISDLDFNPEELQQALKAIEDHLNQMIHNPDLTVSEMRETARRCLKAVNDYTGMANRNIRLLNEQALYLLKKVQALQAEIQGGEPAPDDHSGYEIN